MTLRLLATAILGFVLAGYAPRWLALGSQAWIIWVVAAVIVYGFPGLMKRVGRSALSRLRVSRARGANYSSDYFVRPRRRA